MVPPPGRLSITTGCPSRAELLPDLSRDNIYSAAGQEWNDDLDRSTRIRLCQSGAGRDGAESDRCDRGQQERLLIMLFLPVL